MDLSVIALHNRRDLPGFESLRFYDRRIICFLVTGKGILYLLKGGFLALDDEFGINDFGLCGQIIRIWTIDGLQCKCELKWGSQQGSTNK